MTTDRQQNNGDQERRRRRIRDDLAARCVDFAAALSPNQIDDGDCRRAAAMLAHTVAVRLQNTDLDRQRSLDGINFILGEARVDGRMDELVKSLLVVFVTAAGDKLETRKMLDYLWQLAAHYMASEGADA